MRAMIDIHSKPAISPELSEGIVEIVGDNGAHYKAFIYDIIEDHNHKHVHKDVTRILLKFHNDWHQMASFPITRIRLPPISGHKDFQNNGFNECQLKSDSYEYSKPFVEGMDVEVLSKGSDAEDYGYWFANIKMIKGDFYVVTYHQLNKTKDLMKNAINFSEIVTKDRIRHLNSRSYLKTNPFFKFTIDVPKELVKKEPTFISKSETHNQFKKSLGIIVIRFDEQKSQLICIGYAEKDRNYWISTIKKRAQLLTDMHLRGLEQKMVVMAKKRELQRKLDLSSGEVITKSGEEYELNVKVAPHLIGLAIGTNGSNLKFISKMKGIIAIDNIKGVFRITGSSRESVLEARDRIQFIEKVVEIPRPLVGQVIGKNGRNIQEITDKAGIVNVVVKGDNKNEPLKPLVPFVFVGTRESIESAIVLLNFHLANIQSTDEMKKISKNGGKKITN